MNYADIESLLKAEPFEKFIMRRTDGQSFRVDHPELLAPAPGRKTVVYFETGGADGGYLIKFIDVRHITTAGPIRERAPRQPKKRGK